MANITGDPIKVYRKQTGLYTVDRAFEGFGKTGLPCHSLEWFGPVGCGKSTLAIGLAGILAGTSNIVMMDLETNDIELIGTNLDGVSFSGEFHILEDEKQEVMLSKLSDTLQKDEYSVGILDSVGAVSPVAEVQGDIGDRNMGHRGFIMAQFSRKMNSVLRGEQKNFFAINHLYANLGFAGTTTPGGNALKYLTGNRVPVKRKETFPDGSFVIEGTVKKNRFGLEGRRFYVFILAGQGIHFGLSALYDCIVLGLAERGKVIKLKDTTFGYMKNLVEKAHQKDDEVFEPFVEALKTSKVNIESEAESGLQDD